MQERFLIASKLASVDSSVYLKHALRLSAEDHILTLTEQLIRVRDHDVRFTIHQSRDMASHNLLQDGSISGKGADRSQDDDLAM